MGLSALANAAELGNNRTEAGTSATAITAKHPRHRAGCTCIVCIQPPTGKGKHQSTCTCAVCMTVKRRFKTLMIRKKKRQSDQETGKVRKRRKKKFDNEDGKDNVENNNHSLVENASLLTKVGKDQNLSDDCSSSLDLNCDAVSEEETQAKSDETSLECCMKQMSLNGSTSGEQASSEARPGEVVEKKEGQHLEKNASVIEASSEPPPGASDPL